MQFILISSTSNALFCYISTLMSSVFVVYIIIHTVVPCPTSYMNSGYRLGRLVSALSPVPSFPRLWGEQDTRRRHIPEEADQQTDRYSLSRGVLPIYTNQSDAWAVHIIFSTRC